MNNLKVRKFNFVIFTCVFTLSFTLGSNVFATDSPVKNETVTPQRKLSQEELSNIQNNVEAIHTPFGEFRRVSTPLSLPPSEIAYSVNDITSTTKQLITRYGVFIKKK